MAENKKLGFDLLAIANAFDIQQNANCTYLDYWINAAYDFDDFDYR